jgi:hypothetical protein
MALKHKNSEPAGFDVERQVPYGVVAAGAYESAETTKRTSGSSITSSSRRRVFLGIAGLVGLMFLVEIIIVIAVITGPTVGMVKSLKVALDVFGGQETQQFQIMLNVDSGANLTQVLTNNEALLAAGAQLLAPPLPPPPSHTEEENSKNTIRSAEDEQQQGSVFVEWCQSAPCMQSQIHSDDGDGVSLCDVLDKDLASARNPTTGAPVIPLPAPFCKAVDILNANRCLCDADLADSQVSGEAASIVKSSQLIGTLCRVEMVTPASGKCIK